MILRFQPTRIVPGALGAQAGTDPRAAMAPATRGGDGMIRRMLLIAIVLGAGPAPGEELFRCGSWVINSEMSVADLKAKCGEPTSKSVETQDVRSRVGGGGTIKTGTATVEHWVYDRGSRSFSMVVTIVDGKIIRLERGP